MSKYYECRYPPNVVAVHKLYVLLLGGVDIYERCYVAHGECHTLQGAVHRPTSSTPRGVEVYQH